MNWLAHLLLCEPTPEFRLGGILPDMVPGPVLAQLPSSYQPGIQRHRDIDVFTDAHPVFRRSVQRFSPPLRRYGGILVDVFYDHFLTLDWDRHCDVALPEFAGQVYASIESQREHIPAEAYQRLGQMRAEDLLCSYRKVEGIGDALKRIGSRLRRPFELETGMAVLEHDFAGFQADFAEFFPELRGHVLELRGAD